MRSVWLVDTRSLVHAFVWSLLASVVDTTLTVAAFVVLSRWAVLLFGVAFAVAWWRMYEFSNEDEARFQALLALDKTFGRHVVQYVPRWARLLLVLMILAGMPVFIMRLAIFGPELTRHPLHVRLVGHTLFVYDNGALERAQARGVGTPETLGDELLRCIAEAHPLPQDSVTARQE